MKHSRVVLSVLLLLILVASLGWDAWNDRPYIVTAWGTDSGKASVEYTIPGGGTAEWRLSVGTNSEQVGSCMRKVTVGKRIPDCVRSFSNLLTAQ